MYCREPKVMQSTQHFMISGIQRSNAQETTTHVFEFPSNRGALKEGFLDQDALWMFSRLDGPVVEGRNRVLEAVTHSRGHYAARLR